jgi:two-component system, cell cycle sensor histidine kinase and response regulator CckA
MTEGQSNVERTTEKSLQRALRAVRTLSQCSRAAARACDVNAFLRDVCTAIVGDQGYRMAWVGFAEKDAEQTIRVMAHAGDHTRLLADRTPTWSDTDRGRGPTGTAIRTGVRAVIRDLHTDPSASPWRQVAVETGYDSALSLPLRVDTEVMGAVTVYAERDAFDDEEIRLLETLAEDIGHGIRAIQSRVEHAVAERSLAASEALLRQFIRHTPAAVAMFDRDVCYLQASDRWLQDYHLAGQELTGRSHYEVFPDLPEGWKHVHQRVLAGSVERCDEDPFPRADGTLEWLQWEVRPWYRGDASVGGLIMFTQVITARKRAEAALRESEQRLRQLAENLREAVWMADLNTGAMLYVSPLYEKIWGRSGESLHAAPASWIDALHPADRERITAAAGSLGEGGEYDEHYRIVRPSGEQRWVHDRGFAVRNSDGHVYRLAHVVDDVTERRAIEEQYRQAQKMEAVGQLAGGIAHDFNNLIAAIAIHAELARENTQVPAEVRESLQEISVAAQRAANLTRQILQFSRKDVLQPRNVDLNEIVTGLAKMLQRVLREDIGLRLNLHSVPLGIHADPSMLDQVLMNLAVNARDAMPRGGVLVIETCVRTLSREDARLMPETPAGTYACLRVSDNGCGIDANDLPRIFDPFFTTKETGKGTGLGLATVFGIVKQHHGAVLVSSEPRVGTVFEVLLPTVDFKQEAKDTTLGAQRLSRGSELVLIVEDDPGVRAATQFTLRRYGYQVLVAKDGNEALRIWEARGHEIRLVLTDVVMPGGISGRELALTLLQRCPSLKVVLSSGYSAEIFGPQLHLPDGALFIAKPYALSELLGTIRGCLDAGAAD